MDKKATDLRKRASYDLERDEWLKAQGFQIFRFWNNQVFDGIEAVKETIDPALLKHIPHLGPPPQGGRKYWVNPPPSCEEEQRCCTP